MYWCTTSHNYCYERVLHRIGFQYWTIWAWLISLFRLIHLVLMYRHSYNFDCSAFSVCCFKSKYIKWEFSCPVFLIKLNCIKTFTVNWFLLKILSHINVIYHLWGWTIKTEFISKENTLNQNHDKQFWDDVDIISIKTAKFIINISDGRKLPLSCALCAQIVHAIFYSARGNISQWDSFPPSYLFYTSKTFLGLSALKAKLLNTPACSGATLRLTGPKGNLGCLLPVILFPSWV